MIYSVLVSKTFQKEFQQLPDFLQEKIRKILKGLQDDPLTSRPNFDIKLLQDTHPKKHRLRVGKYRIIYIVSKKEVKVIDIFKRKIGYERIK